MKHAQKFLIVGYGSIGRRHASNLRTLRPDANIAIWHQSGRKHDVNDGFQHLYSREEAVAFGASAAWICNPAPFHIETAATLAAKKCHLFIEKPLSDHVDGVGALAALAQTNLVSIMVGYTLRFSESLQACYAALQQGVVGGILHAHAEIGQHLPEWRPDTDYRKTVSAKQKLGGGVVFELSHELDYLTWMLGTVRSVMAYTDTRRLMGIDVEDTAEILLQHDTGTLAHLHLDMTAPVPTRKFTVTGTDGILTWDGLAETVTLKQPGHERPRQLFAAEQTDRNAMYLRQMECFLGCLQGEDAPVVPLEEASSVLTLALAVKESAATGQRVHL